MFGMLVGKIKFDRYGDIITQVIDINFDIFKDLNDAH